jgi:hypothetical protein
MNNSVIPQKVKGLLRSLYPYSKKEIGAALILMADAFRQVANKEQTAIVKGLVSDILDGKVHTLVSVRKMQPRGKHCYDIEEHEAEECQD